MGVRIIEGKEPGSEETVAVLFDSVIGQAFGPLFRDASDAVDFLEWLEKTMTVARDPRRLSRQELLAYFNHFRKCEDPDGS